MLKNWWSTILVLALALSIYFLANQFIGEPTFNSLEEQIEYANQTGQPKFAKDAYEKLLKKDLSSFDYNIGYIRAHFEIDPNKRNDSLLLDYYNNHFTDTLYTDKNKPNNISFDEYLYHVNLSYICSGICNVFVGDYDKAYLKFSIGDYKSYKYKNNYIGDVYYYYNILDTAAIYYQKEIAIGGDSATAYTNLTHLYNYQKEYNKIYELLEDENVRKFIPVWLREKVYFLKLDVLGYYGSIIDRIKENINIYGFIGAFLVMVFWGVYLREMDVFEPEKWWQIGLILFLGMFFCINSLIIYDFTKYIIGFRLQDHVFYDLIYSVFVIGFAEELVKIIPVFIMLRYTKAINEPFDYILYASLSAIGFGFIENLIYLNEKQLYVLHGRGIISAVVHMFCSSVIAYGMILSRYKHQKNHIVYFAIAFLIAAFIHGIYDYFLFMSSHIKELSKLSIQLFIVSIFIWNNFKNNALNHSDFFDKEKFLNTRKMMDYMILGLSFILFYEYLAVSFRLGITRGNKQVPMLLIYGFVFITFLKNNISKIRLVKGKWEKLGYWGKRIINLEEFISQKIFMGHHDTKSVLDDALPNIGTIQKQISVSGEHDWLIIELKEPLNIETKGVSLDYVLIRTKSKDQVFSHEVVIDVSVFLVYNPNILEQEVIKRKDVKFAGYAKVRVE